VISAAGFTLWASVGESTLRFEDGIAAADLPVEYALEISEMRRPRERQKFISPRR